MPNPHALCERGVFGGRHSAAFPTVTRVNSPSTSTGSYPARHGFTHNTMWLSEMGEEPLSTVSADNLKKLRGISDGELLTTIWRNHGAGGALIFCERVRWCRQFKDIPSKLNFLFKTSLDISEF